MRAKIKSVLKDIEKGRRKLGNFDKLIIKDQLDDVQKSLAGINRTVKFLLEEAKK